MCVSVCAVQSCVQIKANIARGHGRVINAFHFIIRGIKTCGKVSSCHAYHRYAQSSSLRLLLPFFACLFCSFFARVIMQKLNAVNPGNSSHSLSLPLTLPPRRRLAVQPAGKSVNSRAVLLNYAKARYTARKESLIHWSWR